MGKTSGEIRLILLFIPLLAWVALWGCGPRTVTTLVHKDPLFQVHLQQTIGKDHQPIDAGYQHPLSLSASEMERLLKSIQLRYQPGIFKRLFSESNRDTRQAFSDEEVQRMSGGLSQALAAATPANRIAFILKHPRGIFTPNYTSGVIYMKDDRFVIIIGNYQYTFPSGTEDLQNLLANPLDRQDSQIIAIIPGPFQELLPAEKRSLNNRWLSINYKDLLASAPELQPEAPDIATPTTPPGLEEKLSTLKRLQEQGLITEEEYQEKKRELLKEF